jgi:hypothetical protein
VSAAEIVAVAVTVVAAALAGAFAVLLVMLARRLRDLQVCLDDLGDQSAELVAELRGAVRHAAAEVDRVDRLVVAAEGIEERVDGATRLARRTIQSPVVKAMALGAGVSRASERLRTGSDLGSKRRRGKRRMA